MKWHFQMVHHGLWDYDTPAQPNLVTITVNGRRIDAVAQVTKQGFTYVFDRVTGQAVWPIVERQVATDSNVPGEKPHPTQPIPSRPPAFVDQGVSLEDANDLTPEIKAMAQEQMRRFRIGPLVHSALARRYAAASRPGRRRELGRRRVRPGQRLSFRPRGARCRPQQDRRRTMALIRWWRFRTRIDSRAAVRTPECGACPSRHRLMPC